MWERLTRSAADSDRPATAYQAVDNDDGDGDDGGDDDGGDASSSSCPCLDPFCLYIPSPKVAGKYPGSDRPSGVPGSETRAPETCKSGPRDAPERGNQQFNGVGDVQSEYVSN